jgi:protein-S-isoprenylcysteine O-methyltransferase Ste14
MEQGIVRRVKEIARALSMTGDCAGNAPLNFERLHRIRKPVLRVAAALGFLLVLFHRSPWPAGYLVYEITVRGGILLLATAIAGRIWVWAHLGRHRRWHFVFDGPYSIMRHPLYAFSILGASGVGAQSGSVLVTVLFTVAVWAVFNRIARIEETDMTSRFGDLYRAYLARTPRFVPNPALWTARPAISVEYAYVFVCLRDTLWFALAVPGFIAIDWGQEAGLLPVLFRLP